MGRNPNGNNAGTAGNDVLWGTAIVLGDGSYDNYSDIDGAFHHSALRGLGGDDLILGDLYYDGRDYSEGDEAYGGSGNDTIYGDCGPAEPGWQTSYNGGSDMLYGGSGDDLIYGQAGDDRLTGGLGNDRLVGGIGKDLFEGGSGNDTIWGDLSGGQSGSGKDDNIGHGGEGHDLIGGGSGCDLFFADAGNDRAYGYGGADTLEGGNGADRLVGGGGHDRLLGGGHYATSADRADTIYGQGGDDTLLGGAGGDSMFGGTGSDLIEGQAGADFLNGNDGADRLYGGTGADTFYGGNGADHFVFATLAASTFGAAGRDVIGDFRAAQGDRIDLRGMDADSNQAGNQAFRFIGDAAFTGQAGQLHYQNVAGGVLILGDVNGDRVADFAVLLDDPIVPTESFFLL